MCFEERVKTAMVIAQWMATLEPLTISTLRILLTQTQLLSPPFFSLRDIVLRTSDPENNGATSVAASLGSHLALTILTTLTHIFQTQPALQNTRMVQHSDSTTQQGESTHGERFSGNTEHTI